MALALMLSNIEKKSSWNLVHYYLIWVIADVSHIFATILPVKNRLQSTSLSLSKVLVLITTFFVLPSLAIFFSYNFFIQALAFYAIYHIYAQQKGLVFVTSRKLRESQTERITGWCLIFIFFWFPVTYWISDKTPFAQKYYHQGDMIFRFPIWFVDFFHIVFGIATLVFVVLFFSSLLYKEKLNLGKYSLLALTWVWMYGGIVLLQNSFFFWTCLVLIHGGFYIAYCIEEDLCLSKNQKTLGYYSSFLFFIVMLSLTWFKSFDALRELVEEKHFLIGLGWAHLFCHYALDSFIWKQRFSPQRQNL